MLPLAGSASALRTRPRVPWAPFTEPSHTPLALDTLFANITLYCGSGSEAAKGEKIEKVTYGFGITWSALLAGTCSKPEWPRPEQ